jgi:lipopolysaccharide transport system permease protein
MLSLARNLCRYHELLAVLAWKHLILRYKQAYFGAVWALLKPLMLMLTLTLVRGFVSIDSGGVPYSLLALSALLLWIFFHESVSDGIGSVVSNAYLIRKIYFPREILPLTGVLVKLVEMALNFLVLLGLMAWYGIVPTLHSLWAPVILLYAVIISAAGAFIGAAVNTRYRDVSNALPALFSLLMYLSPVIYPLHLVQETLLGKHTAGKWSELLYILYLANPLVGLIDSFQNVMLRGLPPDFAAMLPGLILVLILLPVSYSLFKRAEAHFADFL